MPEYLSSAINADYVQMAVERPWDYGFMSLVRWFDARYQTQYRIGQTLRPSQDAIRLGQHPSVSFSPRELACVQIQNGRIKIEHLGLGLWGQTVHCRFTLVKSQCIEKKWCMITH